MENARTRMLKEELNSPNLTIGRLREINDELDDEAEDQGVNGTKGVVGSDTSKDAAVNNEGIVLERSQVGYRLFSDYNKSNNPKLKRLIRN